MAKRKVSWDKEAWQEFIEILEYIIENSPENAIRVSNRVSNIIHEIPEFPKMFKADELKNKNDGSFRVFIQDRIRISYQITPNQIRIIKVRHSSQEPIMY